jgi:Phasin protein.
MQTPSFEPINEFYKAGCDAVEQLNRSSTRLFRDFARYQLECMKLYPDLGNRQLTMWMSGKNPLEIFAAQAEIANEFATKFMDHFRDAFTSMTDAAAEVMACFKPYGALLGWGQAQPSPEATALSEVDT